MIKIQQLNYLQDYDFLKRLDLQKLKEFNAKIVILDIKEQPLISIEGKIRNGNININGNSSLRRTGSLTFVAQEDTNNLTKVENLLSINKKIKIFIGYKNNIDTRYDDMIWFPLGVFVIIQPNISHSANGTSISLSIKDKMCLLNGENGGTLPTSVTFHSYDQLQENGETISIPQDIFNIIQTLVHVYGNESLNNIIINDLEHEIKQSVRYVGSKPLYYNHKNGVYSYIQDSDLETQTFEYNEDVGYVYTPFTYPGKLISGIGDNVCSVLNKIIAVLGNYEYFYDIEGHFVFQRKRDYLNIPYSPTASTVKNGIYILNNDNYQVDFSNFVSSVYTFEEGNALISSYTNTPIYANIKNDYHIWGKNANKNVIHYHIAIKEKPKNMNTYKVKFDKDNKIYLDSNGEDYTPADWRAEIYMRALTKKSIGDRPDIFEQEILDLFDDIYDMKNKAFKEDILNKPNNLKYFIDYLEPIKDLHNVSIESIGVKTQTYQKDNIKKLYNADIPNLILINKNEDILENQKIIDRCELEGQPYTNVDKSVFNNLAIGLYGYTAHEIARSLLYQHTDYNEAINIQSIPIYHLEPNTKITVHDKKSGIFGDYIINSMSIPLVPNGYMSISASRALVRV